MKKSNTFYLNVQSVMSGRGEIFTTARSDYYQFRSWVNDERKYYSKSLKTKDKIEALQKGEEEVNQINTAAEIEHILKIQVEPPSNNSNSGQNDSEIKSKVYVEYFSS